MDENKQKEAGIGSLKVHIFGTVRSLLFREKYSLLAGHKTRLTPLKVA